MVCRHMLLMMGSIWGERWFLFFYSPVYTGPSQHNRIIFGLRKWVCVSFQPCGEACAGAVLVLQRCTWHQNLVHYIGFSMRTEVQPIAVPKRTGGVVQKHKKGTSVWPDFHSIDLCCLLNLREQLENWAKFSCNWIPNTYQVIYSLVKLCCMQRWGQLFIVRLSWLLRAWCW